MNRDARCSLRYQALLQLLRTADIIWNTSRLFFARWELSPSQFNVLNLLRGAPAGLSQTELSRELITHRSNLTGLVDRLEQRGLVRRRETAGDRRAYRVVLTPAAERVLEEVLPEYYEKAQQVWGAQAEARLSELLNELREVARNAERVARDATSNPNTGRSYDRDPGEAEDGDTVPAVSGRRARGKRARKPGVAGGRRGQRGRAGAEAA